MNNIEKKLKSISKNIVKDKNEIITILDEIEQLENPIPIYNEFIPKIIDHIDGNILLSYIYDKKELEEYMVYLFYKNKIDLNSISQYIYSNILYDTSWGLDYITKNIDKIANTKMDTLISFCQTNNSLYKIFANSFKNSNNRLDFVTKSIHYSLWKFDEEDIIKTIYDKNNKILKGNIANQMCGRKVYNQIIEKYGKELFESEKNNKMTFLYYLSDKYNYLKEKYDIGLMLYILSSQSQRTDSTISDIINYGCYDEFNKKIREKFPDLNLRNISLGTQTNDIFSSKTSILKLGTSRFNNNIDTNFFRIIPTDITYIKDENNKVTSVYEFQKKIDTNPEHITYEMIYELFLDFEKNGKYICDPQCLMFKKENFGLLNSYKEANLGKYNNHEELPDSFKKNPLVLLDIDLVYEYGSNILPPELPSMTSLNMRNAIKDYEDKKIYIKK